MFYRWTFKNPDDYVAFTFQTLTLLDVERLYSLGLQSAGEEERRNLRIDVAKNLMDITAFQETWWPRTWFTYASKSYFFLSKGWFSCLTLVSKKQHVDKVIAKKDKLDLRFLADEKISSYCLEVYADNNNFDFLKTKRTLIQRAANRLNFERLSYVIRVLTTSAAEKSLLSMEQVTPSGKRYKWEE